MLRSANRWSLIAIAALVVLNGILLAFVIRPAQPPVSTTPLPSFTPVEIRPGVVTRASPAPDEAEQSEVAGSEITLQPVQRLLSAASDQVAWRSTTGTCDQPATLERTQDGGATWQPQNPNLAPAIRLKATSVTSIFAVGGNPAADCAPTFSFSGTSGASWVAADSELATAWYLAPVDRATVHGPAAELPIPCSGAVDLAGLDTDRAALLCLDGGVWLTSDGGATWAQGGAVTEAVAIAPSTDGYVLGVIRPATCPGVGVFPVTGDGAGLAEAGEADATPLGCAAVDGAAPGQVALAVAGADVWLWAGEAVVRSADGGLTW